jgi:hypothetical protein
MERLRILASAAALGDFTVDELVAYSGANENTVRAVLRRDSEVFDASRDEATAGTGGRPPHRYRVVDSDRIRAEVRELERGILEVGAREPEEATVSPHDEQLAAIVIAEDAVVRSLTSSDEDDRSILAATARESLRQAGVDGDQPPADELTRRAASVSAFADLAEIRARGDLPGGEELGRAAEALGELSGVAPSEHVEGLFGGLAVAAIQAHELPPLGVVTQIDLSPRDVLPEFRRSQWTCKHLPGGRDLVWSQGWAEPLLRRHLVTALVLADPSPSGIELEDSFHHLTDWAVPRIVVSERESMDAAAEIVAAGAQYLPSSRREYLGSALTSTVAHRTGIAVGDIVGALADTGIKFKV